MKIHLGLLLIGALVLVSGCAKKCPPCPVSAPITYGSGVYSPAASPSSSYSAAADEAVSPYASSSGSGRYVSK